LLYTFGGVSSDGINPWAGLVFDASGNLYGTTFYGGSGGNGTAFKLMPVAGGSWTETILHNFINNRIDGWGPYCNLIFRSDGNLYGTTSYGGGFLAGTVFEITP